MKIIFAFVFRVSFIFFLCCCFWFFFAFFKNDNTFRNLLY